jgi:PAS domain S-box-containing protein
MELKKSFKQSFIDREQSVYNFYDLFDVDELQKLQNTFSDLVGVASIITLLDGSFVTKPSNFSRLCNMIRSTDIGQINCMKSDIKISQMSVLSENGHIQPCLSCGLWDAGVSIVVDGVHLGNWLIGQVRGENDKNDRILEYAETIGIDKDDMLAAYQEIPVMSTSELNSATKLLQLTVDSLCQKAFYKFNLKKQHKTNLDKTEELSNIDTRYKKLLNNINIGVIVCNSESEIIFCNLTACSIFNINTDQLNGVNVFSDFRRTIYNEYGVELQKSEYPIYEILNKHTHIENQIIGVENKQGKVTWIKLSGTPVFNVHGKLHEVVLSFEDVTHEKANVDKIIRTVNSLKETQRIAELGTYTLHLKEQKWYGSELLYQILGIADHRVYSFDESEELLHPQWRDIHNRFIEKAINQKLSSFSRTYKIVKKDTGEERWVTDNAVLVPDQDDDIEMIVGTIQDITLIKNAEEAARRNEEKYKMIFENVQDIYYKVDINNIVSEVSPSVRFFTDQKREEIVGTNVRSFFTTEKEYSDFIYLIQTHGRIRDYNMKINIGKKELPVSVSANIACDSSGNVLFYEGFIRDISERIDFENKLKMSEEKFRKYIEFAPHAIAIIDQNNKITEINPAVMRITGYTIDEISKTDFYEIFEASCHDKLKRHIDNTCKYGLASDELEVKTKSNELKYIILDTVKIPDGKYISFANDITYRKKIENSYRQSHYFLEEAQRIAKIGSAVIDFKSNNWESSQMLNEIIGIDNNYPRKINKWRDIIHPDSLNELAEYFQNIILVNRSERMDREFKIIRHNDKSIRWLQVMGKADYDHDNTIKTLRFTLQDVTERKEWTDLLYRNEALYRTTLNASPDAIMVLNLDYTIRIASPSALAMYKTRKIEKLEGQPVFKFIAEDEIEKVKLNLRLMLNSYPGTQEYKMVRATGKTFQADVNGDVIRDSNEKPTGFVFIIRDISKRKAAELKLAQSREQLKEFAGHLQSIREEEKIALAREIHDDLGQVLAAMKIDLGLLKNKLSESNIPVSSRAMRDEISRIFDLTNKTIAIARRIMTDLRSDAVNQLGFIEAAKLYIENFRNRFSIHCSFEHNVNDTEFTQDQVVALYRILQESLSNIIKHANATAVNVSILKTTENFKFQIKDNGRGFNTNLPRRVDSYGLIGMKERVALLGGEFCLQSEPGKGTDIVITIPI